MPSPLHSKQTVEDGIHSPVSYLFADAAAREAATGFTPEDVNKLARQVSDNSLWLLTAISPTTWSQFGGEFDLSGTIKAGTIAPGAFSGSPKKAAVTFSAPFSSTSYSAVADSVTDGTKTFAISIESKTVAGFVVNLNTNNAANLVEVTWSATFH
jgi:hypothetical protein